MILEIFGYAAAAFALVVFMAIRYSNLVYMYYTSGDVVKDTWHEFNLAIGVFVVMRAIWWIAGLSVNEMFVMGTLCVFVAHMASLFFFSEFIRTKQSANTLRETHGESS